ncbi:MAG: hypothetical protein V4671_12780 [Armatimonadota bacterium]
MVYLVQELETMADMDGWDHFFITSRAYYLGELKAGLKMVEDTDSLAVLEDYERQFAPHIGIMEPEALADFLALQGNDYFHRDRDWRGDFTNLAEERWGRIDKYLHAKGIHLDPSPV